MERATGRELRVSQRVRDNRLVEALVRDSRQVAVLPRFTTPTGAGLVLRELGGVAAVRHVSAVMRPDRAERLAVRRVVAELVRVGREVAADHGSWPHP